MLNKLAVFCVSLSFLLISCAQKSKIDDPYVTPFKVLNICFNEETKTDSRKKGYSEFAESSSSETQVYLLYKIPLTMVGDKISAKLNLEMAYHAVNKQGVHRQLTGQPNPEVVSDEIFSMANGDNGIYGWDCAKVGTEKAKEYMPNVKLYLLNDTKEIKDKILTQGINHPTFKPVFMRDLFNERPEKVNMQLLTVSNNNGYLPDEWISCDQNRENCMTFKASWEQDQDNVSKARLALKQVK